MMFTSFFKAKWQHKDSHVRINAINELLSVEDPKEHEILVSLCENDESEIVRRAALIKLADFAVYVKEKNTNSHQKIQDFCTQEIEKILQGKHDIQLNTNDKLSYLTSLNHKPTLEHWLHLETTPEVVTALYEKLDKPQLLVPLFTQKENVVVQQYLLSQTNSLEVLEKLRKKSTLGEVTITIEEKITRLQEQAEKPKKLRKESQLLLSKLLALKDQSHYEKVVSLKAKYAKQWQALLIQHECLPENESQSFIEKHQQILKQLDHIFTAKAEQYEQALIAQRLLEDKAEAQERFTAMLNELSQHLTTCIFEHDPIDESEYQAKLKQIEDDIQASVLNETEQKSLLAQVKKQSHILLSLPVIAMSISDATHLISKISQLTLPSNITELNERYPIYQEWKESWSKVYAKSNGILPNSISGAYKEIISQWEKNLKPLLNEQKQLVNKAQKKISEFNRLVREGKFKPTFYVFKRLTELFEQLSSTQKQQLQRDYDAIVKKHEELADWEHYIATPRKQELLEEVKALVDTPLDSPNDQAKKVKDCRKKWNALGHADESIEHDLNEAFNTACEEAFAPCRLFYKEQDALRANNLIIREKLLSEVTQAFKDLPELATLEPQSGKTLESQIQALQKKWQSAGEVERDKYQILNKQFIAAIKPAKTLITQYQQQNQLLKENLIVEAQAALAMEDIFVAVNKVKSLQQSWKTIGSCGAAQERKLWQQFRKINDEVFNKRSAVQTQEKHEQTALLDTLTKDFSQIQDQILPTSDVKQLEELKAQVQELLAQTPSHEVVFKNFTKTLKQCIADLNTASDLYHEKAQKKSLQDVFSLLESMANQDITCDELCDHTLFKELSPFWQKKFTALANNKHDVCRETETLKLEIQGNIESPEACKDERLQLQVQLLQESMTSNAAIDLNELLQSWISLGKITLADLPLIKRIKPIYCA